MLPLESSNYFDYCNANDSSTYLFTNQLDNKKNVVNLFNFDKSKLTPTFQRFDDDELMKINDCEQKSFYTNFQLVGNNEDTSEDGINKKTLGELLTAFKNSEEHGFVDDSSGVPYNTASNDKGVKLRREPSLIISSNNRHKNNFEENHFPQKYFRRSRLYGRKFLRTWSHQNGIYKNGFKQFSRRKSYPPEYWFKENFSNEGSFRNNSPMKIITKQLCSERLCSQGNCETYGFKNLVVTDVETIPNITPDGKIAMFKRPKISHTGIDVVHVIRDPETNEPKVTGNTVFVATSSHIPPLRTYRMFRGSLRSRFLRTDRSYLSDRVQTFTNNEERSL
uniref:Uncharacterized protein n=1 Tax=Strongyloides stercoralis TaxID=6248 RepID=A0A0K0E4S3_STRER